MSQFGTEDLILSFFPEGFKGVAVDIGASDGKTLSNTIDLENDGWTVLCVEPNPHYTRELKANRKLVKVCAISDFNGTAPFKAFKVQGCNWECTSALHPDPVMLHEYAYMLEGDQEFETPVLTLDTLLDNIGLTRLDFLSVDVEGGEEAVFKGFNLRKWHPKIIMVEQWTHKHQSLRPLLESEGYMHHSRIMNNDDFYVSQT